MNTDTSNLQNFFGKTIQYQIPLYQRPYVWEEEKQWQPLWDDICDVAEDYIGRLDTEDLIKPHFIGAVVLKQKQTKTSEVEKRVVIDGQQRITTLQILLKAVGDYLASHKVVDNATKNILLKLVHNEDVSEDDFSGQDSKYKMRPSKRDVEAFSVIMRVANPIEIKKEVENADIDVLKKSRIIDAYKFFYEQTEDWLDEETEEMFGKKLKALKNTLLKGIELVFIDLDEKDQEQIIFETLNARGTPLLQFDLVKNYLYYQAENKKANVELIDKKYWSVFDDKNNSTFWEQTVRQGRLYRPASDVFLHHFLTLKKGGEVDAAGLFIEYQRIVNESVADVEPHLKELVTYANIYRGFFECKKNTYEYVFFERLRDMDITTMYPLLLGLYYQLPDVESKDVRDEMLQILESFIVRREVCKLTSKNYNNLFVEILKKLKDNEDFSASGLCKILKKYDADTNRWPSDREFANAWQTMQLYRTLTRSKLRMILKALNNNICDRKSEGGPIGESKLTIEHIMPQTWEENWPIDYTGVEDDEKKLIVEKRESLMHTIGNLTLVTNSLNPAMSNAPWPEKKEELRKHSTITMNMMLYRFDVWNEAMIEKRAKELWEMAATIWPIK